MVTTMAGLLSVRWVLGGGALLAGAVALIAPEFLAARADLMFRDPTGHVWLIYALGMALISLGVAVLTEPDTGYGQAGVMSRLLVGLSLLLYFLALSTHLRDWWIDDAGITFAYSRSLAEGRGLVAQSWMSPEEGYSSSVWMLLLSLAHRLGADIPMTAKYVGVSSSAGAMILCFWILSREARGTLVLVLCGVALACAPTVVWAVSGQEHALQSLILLLVVFCVYGLERWRWPVALLLAVLVLTRPEAPIIVIAVFCGAVYLTQRRGGPLINAADGAVALVPFAAFCGLVGFRLAYFGDPLPNPYYAKSSGAGLIGVFNLLGAGWGYILSGLRETALLLVLWLVFLIPARRQPAWIVIASAVLAGQIFFVIWAKGDWMQQYRFLMPVLPVALLLASLGFEGLGSLRKRMVLCSVAALILAQTTLMQMAAFGQAPTTPLAVVTQVGNTFRVVADRLEIEDPVLAHHDAGGIAYYEMIRLIDLGGLVNRRIGQNMNDKAVLTDYLLEEARPDFVFGARNFAALSGFADTEAFAENYVRIDFDGLPYMRNELSYIRRDAVTAVSGIDPVYDAQGMLVRVRVEEGLLAVPAEQP